MKTKKIYFTPAQLRVLYIAPRNITCIGSRRSGKSEGLIPPILLRNIQQMPGGTHAIAGSSYKQLLTRTLPATMAALKRLGFENNIHYYIGRKAPKNAQFAVPKITPYNWDNFIHWYNGSVSALISQDGAYNANSLTLSSLIIDEAKTLRFDKVQDEILPALTPNIFDVPWECSKTFVSDMPTTKSGMWMLEKEKDMDLDLIEVIEENLREIAAIKQKDLSKSLWYANKLAALRNETNELRKHASLFVIWSVLENLEVVGEEYIYEQARSLSPFKFATAILSKRMTKVEGNFYGALEPKHYYNAENSTFLNNYRTKDGSLDIENIKLDCRADTDIDQSKPLIIAYDTNININWIVVGQVDYEKNVLRLIKSFFVKQPAMLKEVCQEFCDYYKSLKNKDVIAYYDATMIQGKNAMSTTSFYEMVEQTLRDNYYNVNSVYIGNPMLHSEKHLLIDHSLKEHEHLNIAINKGNNEILIEALERTGTRVGEKGWGKDKSDEKEPDRVENPCELRTDGTDAFDTLIIGCNIYPVNHFNLNYSNIFD